MMAPQTLRLKHGAASVSLALAVLCPVICSGQGAPAAASGAPLNSKVFTNPRAPADDPRIGLKGGLYDAGEAASGMERVASLPKPTGFGPGTTPPEAPGQITGDQPPPPAEDGKPPQPPAIQYGSTNSDLAFSGNHLFAGNYNGINFYDIDNPAKVKLTTSLMCPGGQGDVSVYGHLLFMSAEAVNGRIDCGTQGIALPPGYVPPPAPKPQPLPNGGELPRPQRPLPPPSPERFRGVRIFDISDFSNPKQVAAVQSCRGSHTHTLVIDPKDKENVYIYISGTGQVRQPEEMSECSGGEPTANPNTALFRIDIIKVPLAHPEQAKIVSSPRIFTDSQTGAINGLWKGGFHGEGTQTTSETNRCHDITVYSAIGLAAGACSGNGILLDISNPVNPVRIDAVSDPNYAFWHSANFNNDGTKVLFTDEWGGGGQPRCRATDPMNWGADAIFTLSNRKLTLSSYYKMPAPQTELENCVAHNGSLIPIPGRDVLVQAWYQGGVSVVDFTDAAHPMEIAYFDRGPVNGEKRASGGQWSAYWYNGYIYGSEIARGVDVFRLVPNKFITQNEIDAANQVHFDELNVQNQPKITWPANFIVARAYVDQLNRSGALASPRIAALNEAIMKFDDTPSDRKTEAQLKAIAASLDKDAAAVKAPADAARIRALSAIIKQRTSHL
ncbi:MAG: hypothetical protein C5B51_08555 [Terriglobia bacterium]|nr:MAG: hypothetical protein C5B51_08555 [Terriglobia bacterium]